MVTLIHSWASRILYLALRPSKNSQTRGVKSKKKNSENRKKFISINDWWASKIVHEWNGHLELFSQVKENSGQNLPLRTDILQKTVVGCPWPELWKTTIRLMAAHVFVHFLSVDLHGYNVKRAETFWFSRFMEEMWYMFLFTFSTAAHSF